MCYYIKDDGEQCGRTDKPFCHDHEDTRFAALWQQRDDLHRAAEAGRSGP